MAEHQASAPKAVDFYLGVVDLFSIILPGAVFVFCVWYSLSCYLPAELKHLQGPSAWAALLIASYIIGHLIHALGGAVLDKIYDHAYKHLASHTSYYKSRQRAINVADQILGDFKDAVDNYLAWATQMVRLGSSAAAAEIDRLEADHKFFRSLAVVVMLAWPIYVVGNGFSVRRWAVLLTIVPVLVGWICIWWLGKSHDRQKKEDQQRPNGTTNSSPDSKNCTSAGVEPKRSHATEPKSSRRDLKMRLGRYMVEISQQPEPAETPKPPAVPETKTLKELIDLDIAREGPHAKSCLKIACAMSAVWVCSMTLSGLLVTPPVLNAFFGFGVSVLAVLATWRYMVLRLKRTELIYRYTVLIPKVPLLMEQGEPAGKERE